MTSTTNFILDRIQNSLEIGDCAVDINRSVITANETYRFKTPIFTATIQLHSDTITRTYFTIRYEETYRRNYRRSAVEGAGSAGYSIISAFVNSLI